MDAFPHGLVSFAIIALSSWWMPQLTRRDLFFAVTVEPKYRETSSAGLTLRSYRFALTLAIISAAFTIGMLDRLGAGGAACKMGALCVFLVGFLLAFWRGRARTQPFAQAPSGRREVALVSPPTGFLDVWFIQAIPLVPLLLAAVYVAAQWSGWPDTFPGPGLPANVPAGPQLQVVAVALRPLARALALVGIFFGVSTAVAHGTRKIRAVGAAAVNEQRFRTTVRALLWTLACTFSLALAQQTVDQIGPAVPLQPTLYHSLTTAISIVNLFFLCLIAYLGQGGTRLPAEEGASPIVIGDRTADARWKMGLLYFNPDDLALLVERRFGLGYTLNFGRPGSWILLGSVVVLAAAIR
jgi:uncharacterized membrane protein